MKIGKIRKAQSFLFFVKEDFFIDRECLKAVEKTKGDIAKGREIGYNKQ